MFYFTMLRCAMHRFYYVEICESLFLLYLVRYVLTLRMQRTHATLGRSDSFCFEFLSSFCFCIFFFVFLFIILLLCQYSVVMLYVVCVASLLFCVLEWCLCTYVVIVGVITVVFMVFVAS